MNQLIQLLDPKSLFSGFNKIGTSFSTSSDLFASIFAARAEEISNRVNVAASPPPEALYPGEESWQTPVKAIRQEVERYGQAAEDIVLPAERKEEVRELLSDLGMSEQNIEATIQKATREDGKMSLRAVMESLNRFCQGNADAGAVIPAGLAPLILVALEKMGLKGAELDRLAEQLGREPIPMKRLARLLSNLSRSDLVLKAEDVAIVRELLSEAGLSQGQVEEVISGHINPRGRLTMKRLVSLLNEAASQSDEGVNLTRSGRLGPLVARLLEGAEVVGQDRQVVRAQSKALSDQLKTLQAEAKRPIQLSRELGLGAKVKSSWFAQIEQSSQAGQTKESMPTTQTAQGTQAAKPVTAALAGLASAETSEILEEMIKVALSGRLNQTKTEPAKHPAAKSTPTQQTATARIESRDEALRFVWTRETPRVSTQPAAASRTSQSPTLRLASEPSAQASLSNLRAASPGPSQSRSTAPAPAASPRMQPSVLLTQLSGRMMVMIKSGQPTMRLQLYPPDLGHVRVDLKVDGQGVKATLVAENQQVQQILGSHSAELRQSLADQGFNLEQFEVLVQDQEQQTASNRSGGEGQDQNQGETLAENEIEAENRDEQTVRPRRRGRSARMHVVV